MKVIKIENLDIEFVYFCFDGVGCYYNNFFIVVVIDIGERVGVSILWYDYFEL